MRVRIEIGTGIVMEFPLPEGRLESLTLINHGERKISVIKEIRGFTGLGLKEAKDLSESLPRTFTSGSIFSSLESFAAALTEAGATIRTEGSHDTQTLIHRLLVAIGYAS